MGKIIHLPSGHFPNPKTGVKPSVRALAEAVAKARELGVSYKVLMTLTELGRSRLDQLRKLAKNR